MLVSEQNTLWCLQPKERRKRTRKKTVSTRLGRKQARVYFPCSPRRTPFLLRPFLFIQATKLDRKAERSSCRHNISGEGRSSALVLVQGDHSCPSFSHKCHDQRYVPAVSYSDLHCFFFFVAQTEQYKAETEPLGVVTTLHIVKRVIKRGFTRPAAEFLRWEPEFLCWESPQLLDLLSDKITCHERGQSTSGSSGSQAHSDPGGGEGRGPTPLTQASHRGTHTLPLPVRFDGTMLPCLFRDGRLMRIQRRWTSVRGVTHVGRAWKHATGSRDVERRRGRVSRHRDRDVVVDPSKPVRQSVKQ
jgi:hypothetical protein